jgi:hypothetical protein
MTPEKIIYTALFIKNIPALIDMYPPQHSVVFAHHMTIAFRPSSLAGINIGMESNLKIIGRAQDEKGDALLVQTTRSTKPYPHITLSCAAGVPPTYSSQLIEKSLAENSVEYFSTPTEIIVTDGYFNGNEDVII